MDHEKGLNVAEVADFALKSVTTSKPFGNAKKIGKTDVEKYIKTIYQETLDAAERQRPRFQLAVRVIRANGLAAKYKKTTSHPFVTASYENAMRRTDTIEDTLDPEFDTTLLLPIGSATVTSPVKIAIWCDVPIDATAEDLDTISQSSTMSRFSIAPFHRRGEKGAGKMRFLGQCQLKAKQVLAAVEEKQELTLSLQKRNPRSHVKGTITISLKLENVASSSRDVENTEYLESPLWSAPTELGHEEMLAWHCIHDVLEFEALRIEAEDCEKHDARYISVQGQRSIDAFLANIGSKSGNVQLRIVREYTDKLIKETHCEMEWPQIVALLSHYAHQLSFDKTVFLSMDDSLKVLRLSRDCATSMADALDNLLSFMQNDLERYKYQFAAHSKVVPPLFDHFINVFGLAQYLLKTLRPITETPKERVQRALIKCKKSTYRLISAQAQAEHDDNPILQHHIISTMIQNEIQYDVDFFATCLQRHVGIDLIVVNVLGLFHHQEIELRELLGGARAISVDPPFDFFDLLSKLREQRARFIEPLFDNPKHSTTEMRVFKDLNRMFLPHIITWLKLNISKAPQYTQRAFHLDSGERLSADALHSSSVFDLLRFYTEIFYEVAELRWEDLAESGTLFRHYAEIVVASVHEITRLLVAQHASAAATILSSSLCVAINNIAQLSEGVGNIEEQIIANMKRSQKRQELRAHARYSVAPESMPSAKTKKSWRMTLTTNMKRLKSKKDSGEQNDEDDEDDEDEDTDSEETQSELVGSASAVDPFAAVRQAFKLAMEQLSRGLMPLMDTLITSLITTLDQYLSFLLGFRKSKPLLDRVFSLERVSKKGTASAKFGPSKVHGLTDRRMDKVKNRLQDMLQETKHANWHRHKDGKLKPCEQSRSESRLLLNEGQLSVSLEPLLDFLDSNFQILSDNLYEDVFNHTLARVWDAVLDLVHTKINTFKSGTLNQQQSATLYHFLHVVKLFFNADGAGIPLSRLENRAFEAMSEQLLLSKHTTAEITWLYHEHQADKLLEDESKPQIAYHVHLDLGSKLHQDDQIVVRVQSCRNLPKIGSKASITPLVEVTVRQLHPDMPISVETSSVTSKESSSNPLFNHELKFPLLCLRGMVHVAVFHYEARKKTFIGESSCILNDMDKLECQTLDVVQPLTQMLDRRAHTLLKVLTTRKADPQAQEFVQARIGEVRDRGHTASKSKLHVVKGHFFRATRFALPPECDVCKSLILGIGKAVYECELCFATVHKRCHIAADACSCAVR